MIALLLTVMPPLMQAVPLLALLDDLAPRMANGQAGHLQKVVLVGWWGGSAEAWHACVWS